MIINYINTFLIIFVFSFVIHGLILFIINFCLLGNDLKNILNKILDKKIYFISLISFLIFISLNLITNLNKEGNKNVVIDGNKEISLNVTKELDILDSNWIDNFTANSTLEKGDIINPLLIDNLHNNFLLHLIMLYLLIMLVIIFTCKLFIKENPEYPLIKRLPLGIFFHRILIIYISIWQKSSNIWIYSILFFLILFNLAATYSIFNAVLYLKSILS